MVEACLDPHPRVLLELVQLLVGLIVVVVDASHLAKLNKLDFPAKDCAKSFDGVSDVDLLECLDVDEALHVLAARDRQNGKRAPSLGKRNALVDEAHADLALEAALHTHLPELRVVDGGLPVLPVIIHFLLELCLAALLVLALFGLVLDALQVSLGVEATLKLLRLVVLLLGALDLVLLIIFFFRLTALLGLNVDEPSQV